MRLSPGMLAILPAATMMIAGIWFIMQFSAQLNSQAVILEDVREAIRAGILPRAEREIAVLQRDYEALREEMLLLRAERATNAAWQERDDEIINMLRQLLERRETRTFPTSGPAKTDPLTGFGYVNDD